MIFEMSNCSLKIINIVDIEFVEECLKYRSIGRVREIIDQY